MCRKIYRTLVPLYIRKIVRGGTAYRPWRFIFLPFYPFVYSISSVLRRRTFSIVKNILVVNLGAIGDNLLSTPALRALKKKFPQANIDVFTGSESSLQAYDNNPRVRRVFRVKQFSAGSIKYKFSKEKNIFISTLKVFIYYPALIIKILLSNYQLGLNFCAFEGGANFSNILMYLAGIPKRLGNFGTYQELLTNKKERLKSIHWADIYLEIVSLAGAETSGQELEFFTSDRDEKFADDFLKENKINSGEIVFSVCPGGSTYINNKRWGIDKFGEVINRLNTKYSFCVLLLGLEEDKSSIYLLQDKLKVKSAVLLGAKLSRVASLLRKSDVLITNDNAILHLADAAKVPYVVSLFGPTDPRRIAPRNKRNQYVSSRIECAPCIQFDAGDETKKCFRPEGQVCFEHLDPDDVYNKLEILFEELVKKQISKE